MTPDRLGEIYGEVSSLAGAKVIDQLDHHCRDLLTGCSISSSTPKWL